MEVCKITNHKKKKIVDLTKMKDLSLMQDTLSKSNRWLQI